VLAAAPAQLAADARTVLDRHAAGGRVLVSEPGDGDPSAAHTALARTAATEHEADWILPASEGEFWWPRGESLKDALAAMPVRYGVVQGLVRRFVQSDPAEATTRVASPAGEPLERALRPLYRADPELAVEPTADRGRVPLRAWYPFEVLVLGAPVDGDTATVEDMRLPGALAELRAGRPLPLRVPDLVDDAAYAVDCAAVGEVDLPRLEREVAELEGRVAWLEQRFWPRVLRRLTRLGRR
jgi:hypothetical protein